jgi:hypothetical protein
MLIRRVSIALLICAAALLGVLLGLPSNVPAQEEGEECFIAIPNNVTIVVGQSLVIVTGKPSAVSAVNCAPGMAQTHSAVIVDPGGGEAAQNSGILIFADQPLPNGTRLRIISEPTVCNGDLKLYTGVVE